MRQYLPEAIASVLSQDYPRIEYIVVDGGSTDGTPDLLKSYGDRVRWISGPDGGAADAINRGFGMCQGAVFAWLNADDTYRPRAVAKAVSLLRARSDVDVV
jgi:glycosyltransferase involved in cell wall biosynthesis